MSKLTGKQRFDSFDCLYERRTYSSTFGDRGFAAAGPGPWNSLPSHLKEVHLLYNRFWQLLMACTI